jgi:predicted phosphoribosyltransferase
MKLVDPVVLALPRGGVPVAAEIARRLSAPLELVLVRKICVPDEPELAMGAVAEGIAPVIVRNEDVISSCGISEGEFEAACAEQHKAIERGRAAYLCRDPPVTLRLSCAIVVDDGIATGATMRAALRATRLREPRRLVMAVPVAAKDMLAGLQSEADDIVCLETYEYFHSVGVYYDDYRQVTDQEVLQALGPFRRATGSGSTHHRTAAKQQPGEQA